MAFDGDCAACVIALEAAGLAALIAIGVALTPEAVGVAAVAAVVGLSAITVVGIIKDGVEAGLGMDGIARRLCTEAGVAC